MKKSVALIIFLFLFVIGCEYPTPPNPNIEKVKKLGHQPIFYNYFHNEFDNQVIITINDYGDLYVIFASNRKGLDSIYRVDGYKILKKKDLSSDIDSNTSIE